MTTSYTFGDNDRASARLQRLAETYEPSTRALLERGRPRQSELAVDLGCGPGWSTALLHAALRPARCVGLDASERFVDEARARHGRDVVFCVHDVRRAPFPLGAPDLLLCRFLLTHLSDTAAALAAWGAAAAPRARLLVHETEVLEGDHPALKRYYELVAELQRRHGQELDVGARLDASFRSSQWKVAESRSVTLEMPAAQMAELHVANLRTWRARDEARRAFDGAELDALEKTLEAIACGHERANPVRNVVRQIVADLES